MELACKVGTRYPGVDSIKSWENGDVIEQRWNGFYKPGRLASKHHCIIRIPLIDYWTARGDTNWKSTKSKVKDFKKFESSVDVDGKFRWEIASISNFEKTIHRLNFIDYEWLLKENYISQEQYDAIYNPDKFADIELSITNLLDIVRIKGTHDRLDPTKLWLHGSVAQGTFKVGTGLGWDYQTWTTFEADIAAQMIGHLTGEGQDEETAISSSVDFSPDTNSFLLKVTAESGAEHDGGAYGNGARITMGTSDNIEFDDNSDVTADIEISKLSIDASGSGNIGISLRDGAAGGGRWLCNRCLVKGDADTNRGIMQFLDNRNDTDIRNNIVYGLSGAEGISVSTKYTNTTLYNNTSIKNNIGFEQDSNGVITGSLIAKNNLAQGNATDYNDIGAGWGTHAKNISEDDTSPDAAYQSKDVHTNSVFVNYGADNYKIDKNGDSTNLAIIDDGEDITGIFTDDINNPATRRSDPVDIGASQRDPSVGDVTGTSDIDIEETTVASNGEIENRGTSDIQLDELQIASAGEVDNPGVSDIIFDAVSVSSSGEIENLGSSVITLEEISIVAAGIVGDDVTGTSTINLNEVLVSGVGFVGDEVSGTSVINLDEVEVSSAGEIENRGVSDIQLDEVQVDGIGEVVVVGVSVVTIDEIDVDGDGVVLSPIDGTSNIVLDEVQIAAAGVVENRGVSDIQLDEIVVVGNGVSFIPITGTSVITLDELIIAGAGLTGAQTINLTIGIGSSFMVGDPNLTLFELNQFLKQTQIDIEETFLNPDEFAEPVIYKYKSGGTLNTYGIVDEEFLLVTPETEVGVMSTDPYVIMQTNKFTKRPEDGDTMVMRGKNYRVMREEPDGTGVSVVYFNYLK